MDEASFAQLYKSVHLRRFFWAEARRLFARDEAAQKDAVQEAWLRISAQPQARVSVTTRSMAQKRSRQRTSGYGVGVGREKRVQRTWKSRGRLYGP